MTGWDLLKTIKDYKRQELITNRLHQWGGWRALFDPMSHQWEILPADAKINLLRDILDATGASLSEIIRAYHEDYSSDRPDIPPRTIDAVAQILEYSIKSARVHVPD
jgi:hypothetical protein